MAGRSAVEIHIENENLKFGNLMLSLGRLCQRILLKCVHVQQDYFSSFNQSDHCFLAFSLLKRPKISNPQVTA